MIKNEVLSKILNKPFWELTPSSAFKSELIFLTSEEFDILRKHINISDYAISNDGYNTIKIQSYIFIKDIKLDRKMKIDKIIKKI